MSNAHVEGRMAGAALSTLSPLQIRTLIGLAREAYGQEFPPSGLEFDDWRHRQTMAAVEKRGFRDCRNEDFLFLEAHFLRLLGREKAAERAAIRHEMEPRTWALHQLHDAARKANEAAGAAGIQFDGLAYANGFLRNKRHVGLDDADAKAIWHAVYVLARKAAQLRNRERNARA